MKKKINHTQKRPFDTSEGTLYNENDVRKIAEKTANETAERIFKKLFPTDIVNLDNRKEMSTASSDQSDGGTDMSKTVKAKVEINGKTRWITGDSTQKLVDQVMKLNLAPAPVETVCFSQYAEKYINLYKKNGAVEKNTLIGYRSYMKNHIFPFFGQMALNNIGINDIQQYINVKGNILSQKTIKEHLNLLRQIFGAAVEDGLIEKNPCTSSRIKVIGQKSEKVLAYTEEEFKQLETLLGHLSGPSQIFLALSLYTGMRRGELFGLRWENICLDTNTLHVTQAVAWPCQNQGIIKSPKTTNGARTIVIIPQLGTILRKYVQPAGYVLTAAHQNGNQPMTQQAVKCLEKKIQDTASSLHIQVIFKSHRARHTVATFMNNAGADDVSITGIIGHSDVAFTKRQYTNTQTTQLERGMESFSKYIAAISA